MGYDLFRGQTPHSGAFESRKRSNEAHNQDSYKMNVDGENYVEEILTPMKKLEIIQPVASLEVDNKLAIIPMVIPEILRFFKS